MQSSPRASYHRLLNGAEAASGGQDDAPVPADVHDLDTVWSALLGLRDAPTERDMGPPACGAERVLLGYAPTGLIAGCWLTAAAHVRHADREPGAACLDALFLECGEGDAARHRGNRYRGLLAEHGLALPEPASAGFIADPRLRDEDFALALVGLRLGQQRGAEIDPAVPGFHAAAVLLGPPPEVRAVAPHAQHLHERGPDALRLARRCLEALATRGPPDWSRVWRGASLLVRARQAWSAALRPAEAPSAWPAMLALLARKAPYAWGHHRRVQLHGRSLDEWFAPAGSDPAALLLALSRSPWVVPGEPGRSPLTTRLVRFGGPMFGVFTDEELAVVRAWISALDRPAPPLRVGDGEARPITIRPAPPTASPELSLPRLYHRLVRQDPAAPALARAHLERVLPAHPHRSWPRSHHALAAWVDESLHMQVHARDDDGPPPDLRREDVVWLLTQLAPAAVVDGAWLQAVTTPALACSPAAAPLLRIYRDELGAGVPHQHHGNVMRRTLAAEGVTLPACDSEDFMRWPGFVPQAFAMPALWLALANHPRWPELLGLNLAVELAGLGSSYRRVIALLRHHAIDPYFFELHNSIDNNASGHTAWSTRAIALHMDALAARDEAAVAREWRRIGQGYAAYDRTSRPLVRALALRLGPRLGLRLGLRWLRRTFAGLMPGKVA